MDYKFKIGDKVKYYRQTIAYGIEPDTVGSVGIIEKIDYSSKPISHFVFFQDDFSLWIPEVDLKLIKPQKVKS